MSQRNSVLKIIDYELLVSLGVEEKERAKKQKILLSVDIYFKNLPKAATDDNIKNTICYDSLCNELKVFSNKSFSTIEAITHDIFVFIEGLYKPDYLKLHVNKFPKIENLRGGVSFTISNHKL
jgi:FolB domain-containing protein